MRNPFARPPVSWITPPASILDDAGGAVSTTIDHSPDDIAAIVAQCGVTCKPHSVVVGASVIQYHLDIHDLRFYGRVMRLAPAISAALHRQVSVSASPSAHFCVSVARTVRDTVPLKKVILTETFNGIREPTAAVLGATIDNNALALDVAKMPHMLISGATGSGKSVCLNTIICSMLFKATPVSLNFVMIDVKQTELTMYEGLPHLARPVITNATEAINALDRACDIMDARYTRMRKMGVKDVSGTGFPRIVIVIDELADLMLVSKATVQEYVVRLAQKGRACGIHLVIATQQPRVAVLTGLIRANIPCKIALKCATAIDSRIALGCNGAETLLGKGDALLCLPSDSTSLIRFQVAHTSDDDIRAIVAYWRK